MMTRTRINLIFFFMFCTLFPMASPQAEEKIANRVPSVFAPIRTYEFEPVLDGIEVTHDFVIENRGDAPLKIIGVRTTCGCTTVSYPKEIPAGGSDKIVAKFDTTGYGGSSVNKKLTVMSNDPSRSELFLTITGQVDRFVQITPSRATLSGKAGDMIKAEITITPEKRYPFKVIEVRAKNGKDITYDLKEIKSSDITKYLLTVTNLKKTEGRYYDVIYLKTDNALRPEININVSGNILGKD